MTPPGDIALLSSIRGRFRFSRHERFLHRLFGALCAVVFPSIMLYALFEHGLPKWPLARDELVCAIVAPLSFALGVFLWCSVDGEYEFTGVEIVYRKAGSVRWRLPIASITRVRVEVLPRSKSRVWHLQAGSISRSILVVDPLAEYVERTTRPNQAMQRTAGRSAF